MIFGKSTKRILGRKAESFETEKGYLIVVYRKKGDQGYKKKSRRPFLSMECPLQAEIPPEKYVWLPSAVEYIDEDLKRGNHVGTFEELVNSYKVFDDVKIFCDERDKKERICSLEYQNEKIGIRLEPGRHPYVTFEENMHLFPNEVQEDADKTFEKIEKPRNIRFFRKRAHKPG